MIQRRDNSLDGITQDVPHVLELKPHLNKKVTVMYTEIRAGTHYASGVLTGVSDSYVELDKCKLYFNKDGSFWINHIKTGEQVVYQKKTS